MEEKKTHIIMIIGLIITIMGFITQKFLFLLLLFPFGLGLFNTKHDNNGNRKNN